MMRNGSICPFLSKTLHVYSITLVLEPLKPSKHRWFSDVFRGYRNGTLALNTSLFEIFFQSLDTHPTDFKLRKKCLIVMQKQSFSGVLRKMCSENMHQIYRRTPMPTYDFNKVAKLLCWNLPKNTFGESLLVMSSVFLQELMVNLKIHFLGKIWNITLHPFKCALTVKK